MKIVCVCGMGLGSSVIAKMNVEAILRDLGVSATVETCDVGSVRGVDADWYLTTRELADRMPEATADHCIVLTNFIVKNEVAAALRERIDAAGAAS